MLPMVRHTLDCAVFWGTFCPSLWLPGISQSLLMSLCPEWWCYHCISLGEGHWSWCTVRQSQRTPSSVLLTLNQETVKILSVISCPDKITAVLEWLWCCTHTRDHVCVSTVNLWRRNSAVGPCALKQWRTFWPLWRTASCCPARWSWTSLPCQRSCSVDTPECLFMRRRGGGHTFKLPKCIYHNGNCIRIDEVH